MKLNKQEALDLLYPEDKQALFLDAIGDETTWPKLTPDPFVNWVIDRYVGDLDDLEYDQALYEMELSWEEAF